MHVMIQKIVMPEYKNNNSVLLVCVCVLLCVRVCVCMLECNYESALSGS